MVLTKEILELIEISSTILWLFRKCILIKVSIETQSFFHFKIFKIMFKKVNLSFLILIFSIMFVWTSCATKKASGPSYVGNWKYEVPEMPGDNTGVLVISKESDAYKCVAITDSGYEQNMDNFDIQDGKFMASYDSQGVAVEVTGTFDGNTVTGTISAQGMTMDWSAVKVEQ